MENQASGSGSSGGRGKRQSSLPSSLIPLLYTGPHRHVSASPSQSDNLESSENPPLTATPLTSTPSSPAPPFALHPIDSSQVASAPDQSRPPPSRVKSTSPGHGHAGTIDPPSSSVSADIQSGSRLGVGATDPGFRPPREGDYSSPSYTFPPVPRILNVPYSFYGEDDAGTSSITTGRRSVVPERAQHSVQAWPQSQQGQSSLHESDWIDDLLRPGELHGRRQRPSGLRHPTRIPGQGDPFIAESSASVPTYRPAPMQPGSPLQGQQSTPRPGSDPSRPSVYYADPYVAQTHSYTPIAPQYFPRYYEMPAAVHSPGYQLHYQEQLVTPKKDPDSEEEAPSTSSRSRGRVKISGIKAESSRAKAKRRREADDELDDDDDDEAPKKKVSRKTEVACDFCRRRKLRCDGARPTCRTCETRKEPCTYVDYVRRRGPGKAPKGSKKLAKRKGPEFDPFTNMLDLSYLNRPFTGRPESSTSVEAMSGIAPQMISPPYPSPSQFAPRNPASSHMHSQSPGASTSEREFGSSGEPRQRKRAASQRDRSKRSRRHPEKEETDDPFQEPPDEDMPFEGQPP